MQLSLELSRWHFKRTRVSGSHAVCSLPAAHLTFQLWIFYALYEAASTCTRCYPAVGVAGSDRFHMFSCSHVVGVGVGVVCHVVLCFGKFLSNCIEKWPQASGKIARQIEIVWLCLFVSMTRGGWEGGVRRGVVNCTAHWPWVLILSTG